MINNTTLEVNVATEVTYRTNREKGSEYITFLGIHNFYTGQKKFGKIPINILLQNNCVNYAKSADLRVGRRIIVGGRLSYSEEHKSYTVKADQLTVFPEPGRNDDPVNANASEAADSSSVPTNHQEEAVTAPHLRVLPASSVLKKSRLPRANKAKDNDNHTQPNP